MTHFDKEYYETLTEEQKRHYIDDRNLRFTMHRVYGGLDRGNTECITNYDNAGFIKKKPLKRIHKRRNKQRNSRSKYVKVKKFWSKDRKQKITFSETYSKPIVKFMDEWMKLLAKDTSVLDACFFESQGYGVDDKAPINNGLNWDSLKELIGTCELGSIEVELPRFSTGLMDRNTYVLYPSRVRIAANKKRRIEKFLNKNKPYLIECYKLSDILYPNQGDMVFEISTKTMYRVVNGGFVKIVPDNAVPGNIAYLYKDTEEMNEWINLKPVGKEIME